MTAARAHRMSRAGVLLLVPNLIGFLRVALLLVGVTLGVGRGASTTTAVFLCFALQAVLDAVDGAAARRLGQVSGFGAFLDVVVDNAGRAILWSWAVDAPFGALVPLLEGVVFACTHRAGGSEWKVGCFADAPPWVQAVMANGFRTPLGSLAMGGVHGLPLWLFVRRRHPGVVALPAAFDVLGAALVAGRVLGGAVEGWVLVRHAGGLLEKDVQQAARRGAGRDAAASSRDAGWN